MPWRVFPSSQMPSAEIIQKYLMDQAVIVCTSLTRPGVPVEGMVIFETDTGQFRVWIGGVWNRFAATTDWDESGNLTVNGTLSTTGQATVGGGLTVTGDAVTIAGFGVNRLVDGKTVGSVSNTGNVNAASPLALPGANAQNVSVIAGRAYRVSGQISVSGSLANSRFALEIWNGSVGGTKLGNSVNCRIWSSNFQSYPFQFLFKATTTESMSNINLSLVRVGGSTETFQSQTDENYFMIVEHLGAASDVSGL